METRSRTAAPPENGAGASVPEVSDVQRQVPEVSNIQRQVPTKSGFRAALLTGLHLPEIRDRTTYETFAFQLDNMIPINAADLDPGQEVTDGIKCFLVKHHLAPSLLVWYQSRREARPVIADNFAALIEELDNKFLDKSDTHSAVVEFIRVINSSNYSVREYSEFFDKSLMGLPPNLQIPDRKG